MAEKKNMISLQEDNKNGSIQIAPEVLAEIAGLAATEVDGVTSLGGNITHEKIGYTRKKTIFKGIQVDVLENIASVRTIITIKYGFSIPEITKKVQERIKSALESMTGLEVADVNVSVADVSFKEPKKD